MMSRKVSVIATVKDEADSIESFLAALLNQSRIPDEIIISDGGSSDGTREIIRRTASRNGTAVRLIDAPGTNIARGRNLAIEHCGGPIVAVTDAGAVPKPDWLEQLVRPLEADRADVSAGFFAPGGTEFVERCISAVITPQLSEIDAKSFLPSSRSLAFRKDWWERAGGYPEWLDHCEDVVFDLELRRQGAVLAFVPDAIVTWHPRSTMRGFARQYYYYARGDAHAGLWRGRHALRYVVYLAFVALLARARRRPTTLGLVISGGQPYLARYYRRTRRAAPFRTPLQAALANVLIPAIVIVGDGAKMLGYAAGHAERIFARHRPNART